MGGQDESNAQSLEQQVVLHLQDPQLRSKVSKKDFGAS